MARLGTAVQTSDWHGRKYRRFELAFPVRMKVQVGSTSTNIETVSRNVSVGGLLVRSMLPVTPGTHVSFVLTVHGEQGVRPIQLVGEGKVVRVEAEEGGASYFVAVKCDTPVTHLEEYLPA